MKAETFFIHAGLPKTGTTALQAFLAQNREILEALGYIYPHSGVKWDQHYYLFASLQFNTEVYLNPDFWESLKKEISEKEKKNVIISSEDFSGFSNYEILRETLKQIAKKVIVIFYLRRQEEWLKSAFKTRVKMSETRFNSDFPTYLKSGILQRSRHFLRDYPKRLEEWSSFFGKENVIVRPYRYVRDNIGTIKDLLNIIGIPKQAIPAFKGLELETHESAPDIATDLICRLNNLPGFFSMQWKIVSLIINVALKNKIGLGKTVPSCCFPEEEMKYVQDNFVANNKFLVPDYLTEEDAAELIEPLAAPGRQDIYTEEERIEDQEKIIAQLPEQFQEHIKFVLRRAGYSRVGDVLLPKTESARLAAANKRLNLELRWAQFAADEEQFGQMPG